MATCDGSMEGLAMTGTVTYDVPLRLILNLDNAGNDFTDLCAAHRQEQVDVFVDGVLTLVNRGAPVGVGMLVRAEDPDAELARVDLRP